HKDTNVFHSVKHLSDFFLSGKVLQPDSDKKAAALNAFNRAVSSDQRIEKVILPIRDGLTLIRKK
ncbi:MAG: hypothetical protein ACO3FI_09275, partial [Cyclobacteriaceae bacterium]